jgi:hypothetical protein
LGSLIAEAAMVIYPPPRIKMGEIPSFRGARSVNPESRAVGFGFPGVQLRI